jgi:pimeloyl-ACP methyl ester carboxylesterase
MTTPAKQITVILVRGLLGMIYSRGMDTLAGKLSSLGYNTQVWNHSFFFLAWFANKQVIADEIKRLRDNGQTVVLVGHSFGANVLLMAARLIPNIRIALLIAIDPAAQYDLTVPGNIQRAIGIRQAQGAIGRGQLKPTGTPRITDLLMDGGHTWLDDAPVVHNRVIAEVAKL